MPTGYKWWDSTRTGRRDVSRGGAPTGGAGSSTGDISRSRPWVLSCESWMAQGAYIILPINPEQLNFDLAARISNDQARALQVQYIWRNYDRDGTSFVLPTISLTVNSGYIVPSFDPGLIAKVRAAVQERTQLLDVSGTAWSEAYKAGFEADIADSGMLARIPDQSMTRDYISSGLYREVGLELEPNPLLTDSAVAAPNSNGNLPGLYSGKNKTIPIGVQNLYAMFSLIDERRIRKTSEGAESKTDDSAQTENRAMIVISTPAWPRLVCYGWFSEDGLKFSETADDPTHFNMDFSFIITDTEPRLGYGQWQDIANTYAAEISDGASTLDIARAQWPNNTPSATPASNRAPAYTAKDPNAVNASDVESSISRAAQSVAGK